MTPKGNTFPKSERLCSRKAIETLFAGGNRAFSAFPLRVVYRVIDEPAEQVDNAKEDTTTTSTAKTDATTTVTLTKVLISVSKRHFKHAVDRNRAKRQIREAWRLNRNILRTALPLGSSKNPATAPAAVPASVPASLSAAVPATVPASVPAAVPATVPASVPATVPEESASVSPLSLHLAFIWLSDEPQPSDLVQRKMKKLLYRIKEQIDTLTY